MKLLLLCSIIFCISAMLTAQPTAGLVAYWPMNGNFNDAGPNGIHGTNVGATATTNAAGTANTAIAFSNPGSTVVQYATHPVNAALNFSGLQDFTYSFSFYLSSPWIRTGGFYDNNLNYSGPGIWIWQNGGATDYKIQLNYRNASLASTPLQLGTWIKVCCLRSAGSLRIYINGILNASGTEGTQTPVYNYTAKFGSMFFNGLTPPQYNGFNGKLDEFRIYNRALTQAEITALAVLPVSLSYFTVSKNNNSVMLKWQTQYEQNSSHYNIQRSIDGVNFTEVGRVNAAGNSNLPLNYSYTDLLPAAVQTQKTVFYRLQSVDLDGKFSLSQIAALQLGKKDMQLSVFPNPAQEVLQVQTGNGPAGNATILISDISGRQLYRKEFALQRGSNVLPVNISMLSAGIYYIRMIAGENNYTQQFVKD